MARKHCWREFCIIGGLLSICLPKIITNVEVINHRVGREMQLANAPTLSAKMFSLANISSPRANIDMCKSGVMRTRWSEATLQFVATDEKKKAGERNPQINNRKRTNIHAGGRQRERCGRCSVVKNGLSRQLPSLSFSLLEQQPRCVIDSCFLLHACDPREREVLERCC